MANFYITRKKHSFRGALWLPLVSNDMSEVLRRLRKTLVIKKRAVSKRTSGNLYKLMKFSKTLDDYGIWVVHGFKGQR